jgi:hypothetical protein
MPVGIVNYGEVLWAHLADSCEFIAQISNACFTITLPSGNSRLPSLFLTFTSLYPRHPTCPDLAGSDDLSAADGVIERIPKKIDAVELKIFKLFWPTADRSLNLD